jgi:hypothetical protein
LNSISSYGGRLLLGEAAELVECRETHGRNTRNSAVKHDDTDVSLLRLLRFRISLKRW